MSGLVAAIYPACFRVFVHISLSYATSGNLLR